MICFAQKIHLLEFPKIYILDPWFIPCSVSTQQSCASSQDILISFKSCDNVNDYCRCLWRSAWHTRQPFTSLVQSVTPTSTRPSHSPCSRHAASASLAASSISSLNLPEQSVDPPSPSCSETSLRRHQTTVTSSCGHRPDVLSPDVTWPRARRLPSSSWRRSSLSLSCSPATTRVQGRTLRSRSNRRSRSANSHLSSDSHTAAFCFSPWVNNAYFLIYFISLLLTTSLSSQFTHANSLFSLLPLEPYSTSSIGLYKFTSDEICNYSNLALNQLCWNLQVLDLKVTYSCESSVEYKSNGIRQ